MASKEFLNAANWALLHERQKEPCGIIYRRMKIDNNTNIVLFNVSKNVTYDGYLYPEQTRLKGLIVLEENNQASKVLAACFPKFFNLGEPAEKDAHVEYLKRKGINILYTLKEDGVNIRAYSNIATNRTEFATRGTLLGIADDEENAEMHYGEMARAIATEKYPVLLTEITKQFSFVFEMIHPHSKIITNYGDVQDLILLTGFCLQDCRELTRTELVELAHSYKLNLVPLWHPEATPNDDFYQMLDTLKEKWNNTDKEGTVVVFEDSLHMPLYRLKVKNAYYLELLKLLRFCTLKNTKELAETYNLKTWEDFRQHLRLSAAMSVRETEEIEMGYREHFDKYFAWCQKKEILKQSLLQEFLALPKFATRKEFALFIKDNFNKSFFFAMLDYLLANGKIDENFWTRQKVMTGLENTVPLNE